MPQVEVVNLMDIDAASQVYTCTPREAVIAAYAQTRNDYNTWDYETRYGHMVQTGRHTVACGDFTAFYRCPICGQEHDHLETSVNGRTKGCPACIKKHDKPVKSAMKEVLRRREKWGV